MFQMFLSALPYVATRIDDTVNMMPTSHAPNKKICLIVSPPPQSNHFMPSIAYIIQPKLPRRVLRSEQEPRAHEQRPSREPDRRKGGHVRPSRRVDIIRCWPGGYVRRREVDDVARHGVCAVYRAKEMTTRATCLGISEQRCRNRRRVKGDVGCYTRCSS